MWWVLQRPVVESLIKHPLDMGFRLQIRLESALILTGLKALLEVRSLPHPGFCLFLSFPEDPLEQRREF